MFIGAVGKNVGDFRFTNRRVLGGSRIFAGWGRRKMADLKLAYLKVTEQIVQKNRRDEILADLKMVDQILTF